MEMIGNSNLDGPRASGKQFFDLCDDRRLALDDVKSIAVADYAGVSACTARRSGSG
jgi:hypothetical protein